jgi:hypothetical protein
VNQWLNVLVRGREYTVMNRVETVANTAVKSKEQRAKRQPFSCLCYYASESGWVITVIISVNLWLIQQ